MITVIPVNTLLIFLAENAEKCPPVIVNYRVIVLCERIVVMRISNVIKDHNICKPYM